MNKKQRDTAIKELVEFLDSELATIGDTALEQIESEMADVYESLANDEQGYRKLEAMRNFFQGLSSGQYLADMMAKIEEVH